MSNYLNKPKNKNIPFYFDKHYQDNNICDDTNENFWVYGPYGGGPYWRPNPYMERHWGPGRWGPGRWGPRRWGPGRWW